MAGFFSPEKMMEGLQSLGSLGKVVEPMPRNATQQKVDEEMKVRGFETLKDGATEEEFAKIFGMKEPLLMWYHASLRTQYNFLLQGKLYFTESFVGFHSYFTDSVTNFGEDTIVMLEHHSIKEVVKTTHLMIPASIEILQHNGTIFHIASLAQRDKVTPTPCQPQRAVTQCHTLSYLKSDSRLLGCSTCGDNETQSWSESLFDPSTNLLHSPHSMHLINQKREAPTKFPGKPNVFNFQGMFAALPSKEEGASPSAKPPTATSPTTTAPPAAKPSPTQPSAIKPTPPTPTPAPTQPPAPKPQPTQPPAAKPQPTQPPKVQPNTFPPVAKAQPTTPPPGPKAQPGTTPATKVQPTAPPSSSGGVVSLGSISMGPKPGEEAKIVKKPAMDLEDGVKYEGEWKGGKKHGKGLQIWPDGKRYEGQFENGLACGKGKFTFKNGDTYDGMWRDDKAHGNGVYTTKEGDRYDGSWHADNKHGKAKETFADGSKFIGVYK
eukprot:GHVN01019977.1.p1 GENE.GHVN01019977.1~~GHVN01019977.1.p1  ORF type:complete len:491 (-),score=119.12 GHVN01019977.1:1653-3125(-)